MKYITEGKSMKQSFMRKIALLMCTVMLFCALPLNINTLAATTSKTEIVGATDKESEVIEVLKEIIDVAGKIVVALKDYFAEQENAGQEQTPPANTDDGKRDLSETGIAGYLYDAKENCFYTASDPWQRIVGYNELFDIFSEIAFIDFDTVRFKFDYKKENWMIQIWKGQYGLLFYGAEMGIYKKPADRKIAHYDSVDDSERLKMSMDFYEYEKKLFKKAEWNKKFSRPYDYYWWCTGFIPGNRNDEFDKLRVDARITAKDYDMLSGITQAMKKQGVDYRVKGLDIMFTYH